MRLTVTGLQISIILLAIALAVAGFFWVASIVGTVTADARLVQNRIDEKIKGKKESIFDNVKGRKNIGKKKAIATTATTSKFTKKLVDAVFNELMAADIAMAPEEFILVWLVAITVPSGLGALFSSYFVTPLALAIVATVAPIIVIKSKKKKRTRIFEEQLGDGLMIMCNSLRSGLTFQQAMDAIAKDMTGPIAIEFARTVKEIKYGTSLEDSLNNMVHRIKSGDLLITVSAVNIQRQTGGNLSVILETIAETIKDRLRIKSEIHALTSQGRMSGLIIGALPVAIGLILMVASPDYMTMFFTTSTGRVMLIAAAVLEILGFAAINKIVTIEY